MAMSLRSPTIDGDRADLEPQPRPRTPAKRADAPAGREPVAPHRASLTAWLVAITVAVTLVWGFTQRDAWGLTPGRGTGYWIGIAGGVGILATLAYPLRKYWRPLRNSGTVVGWFKVHMLLGIFGPAVILFHSNFHLGALNSNVALITMLCVAGSGIVGRYLYGKIHYGLHGRRSELSEMVSQAADMRRTLGGDLPQNSPMWSQLLKLEANAREPSRGIAGALIRSISLAGRANVVRHRVVRDTKRFIDEECRRRQLPGKQRRAWHRIARAHLEVYFQTVKGAARLILFERLFALWHVLHVPIFVVMVLSAVVHVVAVHFY